MAQSHRFRYQDEYGQVYTTTWEETPSGYLDITTETRQPYVWGKAPEGSVSAFNRCAAPGRNVYRVGVRTVHRQILAATEYGYDIVMEGSSQEVAPFQVTFNCPTPDEPAPIDPFMYHLGGGVTSELSTDILEGPRWADPGREGGDAAEWPDLNSDGTSQATVGEALRYVDVWA